VERLLARPRARIAAGAPDTLHYRLVRLPGGGLRPVGAADGVAGDPVVPRYRQLIRAVRRLHWDWPLL
jgi:hypothetical protein